MFKIRDDMMGSFEDDQQGRWEEWVMEHLTRACPEAVVPLSEQEFRERVQQCRAKAATYGILAADQVASFTQILFEEGFDFDEAPPDPWVTAILADPGRDQFTKVDHLWAFLDGYEQEDIENVQLVDEELIELRNAEEEDDDEFEGDVEQEDDYDDEEDEELEDFDEEL